MVLRRASMLNIYRTGQCAEREEYAPEKAVIFAWHTLFNSYRKLSRVILPTPQSFDFLLPRQLAVLKHLFGRRKERGRRLYRLFNLRWCDPLLVRHCSSDSLWDSPICVYIRHSKLHSWLTHIG